MRIAFIAALLPSIKLTLGPSARRSSGDTCAHWRGNHPPPLFASASRSRDASRDRGDDRDAREGAY
jgi:hypothetical protein